MKEKKTAKKVERKPMEDHGHDPLNAKEIKEFQGLVARIGARKSEGFIFMAEVPKGAKKDDECIEARGLVFSNGTGKKTMVFNLIERLFPDTLPRLLFAMELMEFLKDSVGRERR